MQPVDLSKLPGVIHNPDTLEMAKALQFELWQTPEEFHRDLGKQAIAFLGDPETINGLQKVYIHAFGAFVLSEGFTPLSDADEFAVGKFTADEDWRVRANFGRFVYVEYQSLNSICLKLLQPSFIEMDTAGTILENRDITQLSMYVPVHSVETVLAA